MERTEPKGSTDYTETAVMTDQLSAHLDRGWELMSRGDYRGAFISASKVLEIDPDSPEGHTLLGAVAWAGGDPDEAMESFEQAMGLDPEYPEPIVYAAEVAVQDPERLEEALRLCDQAMDALDPEEERDLYIDVGLLKAEILLAKGKKQECTRLIRNLTELHPASGIHCQRIGRLHYDLREFDEAREWLERAVSDRDFGDAHYFLAALAERKGDFRAAVSHFFKVRQADLKDRLPGWSLSDETFRERCFSVLEALPDALRPYMKPEFFVFSDYPSVEVIADGGDPRMGLHFSGVSAAEATETRRPRLDYIFVYKMNIERACQAPEDIPERFDEFLTRESAHFLGIDDDEAP